MERAYDCNMDYEIEEEEISGNGEFSSYSILMVTLGGEMCS